MVFLIFLEIVPLPTFDAIKLSRPSLASVLKQ